MEELSIDNNCLACYFSRAMPDRDGKRDGGWIRLDCSAGIIDHRTARSDIWNNWILKKGAKQQQQQQHK